MREFIGGLIGFAVFIVGLYLRLKSLQYLDDQMPSRKSNIQTLFGDTDKQ